MPGHWLGGDLTALRPTRLPMSAVDDCPASASPRIGEAFACILRPTGFDAWFGRASAMIHVRCVEWETGLDSGQLSLLVTAAVFAARKHKDQRRKDDAASPYINHPLALADVLVNEAGVNDLETIVAALLHDTIEDTETTAAEIEDAFGPRVRAVVEEVTDDSRLDKASRKQAQIDHAPQLSLSARAIKLADKICNLRDVVANPPAGWSLQRRRA